MKKLFTLSLGLFTCISIFAQNESSVHCSKRTRFQNHQLKSASLSEAQIAETEKYDVHFYSIDISMNNLQTDVAGTGEIHAIARENLDSALFELFQTMNVSQIRVNGNPITYSRNISAIKVPVNVLAGQSFVISVDYNGTPPTAATNPLGGAGMTNDSSPSWGNDVTWSLSEPFSAYEWWPCKQSLTDKADSCAVKVTVPSTCKAGSNGVLENVVDLGNGTSRYEWKHRHPIDYYLISVAVAEYVEYNVYANPAGAPNPILIQNFVYNNPATLPNFQSDIDETVDFLELFSDLYGLYPFHDEKYGHCMAPLSGGMEHQTMTTQGWFEQGLTAHELGHQWWGDNVTCASWADIWVNEGFASYSEYLMKENLYPSERAQHLIDIHEHVMEQPGGSVYCLDSLNDSRIFDGRLTYDKGAGIVHMIRFLVNDDVEFFQGLKNYQNAFKDSVAVGLDFKNVMESTSGIDLDPFFDEWYFGQGYPTYSARWNTGGPHLYLEITHTSSMPAVTPTFTNPIEIRFSRIGQADTIIRFDISTNQDQFVVPNVGMISNLISIDPANWVINKMGTKVKDPNLVLSIDELTEEFISVYPNPTTDLVNVRLADEKKEYLMIISDMNGKVIRSEKLNSSTQFSIQKYDSGVYNFSIELSGKTIYTNQIIKK